MDEADGPARDENPKTPASSSEGGAPAAHDADATIDTPGSPLTPAGISSPDDGATPETRSIGAYRLVQKLGEGGMGQVWLAEQTAPLRHLVALKLIRAGVSDNVLLEREAVQVATHIKIQDGLSGAWYISACGATVSGHPDDALEDLRRAIDAGYTDTGQMASEDQLKSLRGTERFKALLAETRKRPNTTQKTN